jgi:magnesium-transporting ATPase (P-type)
VVTGAQLADESESGLIEVVKRARVFARVAPRQKLEIVQAAQRGGQYVAVTGDGVNDAPALRQANIGVAMGKSGTDVAREAAELVISDDNFTTIVAGVEEGRIAYDNIRKVTLLLVSTGAAEVVMVILAVALGYPLPLTAVQLLWLNLVTNGIQHIGLSFEPGEGDVLKRKPRSPSEPIFNRLMIERTLVSAFAMGGVSFLAFAWMIGNNWEPNDEGKIVLNDARNILLLLMVLFENVHVGNCRSESKSLFRINPISNPIVLAGVLAALLIHVVAMYTPFGASVLGAYPVDWRTWLILLALACTVNVAVELHKLYWNWRSKRRGEP